MKIEHDEIKLNIGCGKQKEEGWIGLDKGEYGQEIVRDIRKGLPFCDNSVDRIRADSVLEHIQMNEDFIFVMNECLRVLKRGGEMYVRVPCWRGESAHKDPTHCRFFDVMSFSYLESANAWHYGFDKRWKVEKKENHNNITLEFWLIADK